MQGKVVEAILQQQKEYNGSTGFWCGYGKKMKRQQSHHYHPSLV
jgi:hypothetical protein